jgi:hypothetical protein
VRLLLVYPFAQMFHLRPRLKIFSEKKGLINLVRLIEKFKLDNLHGMHRVA